MLTIKMILLVIYATGVLYFCLTTLRDPQSSTRPVSLAKWYLAIILPLVTIGGAMLHHFDPAVNSRVHYGCLVLWIHAIVACFSELSETKELGGDKTMNLVVGSLILATLFGPGLFLGAAWLRIGSFFVPASILS